MEANDIVVSSWAELMFTLYDIPRTAFQRYRSDFVYRGVADLSWGLETSLKRLGNVNAERGLLVSLGRYSEPGWIPADTLWVRPAVAQHHGLPTSMLDWALSPRVALHFATAGAEHYDKDGALWCINVGQSRSFLPKKLQAILAKEYSFVFSVEMLDEIKSLANLDALGTEHGSFVLFFEPPSLDARIVN
jgi:hypothetical protein